MDASALGIGKRRQFYTPFEVSQHNSNSDCWVSIFHKVYDITPLLADELAAGRGTLTEPLVKFAGQDLSDWFDKKTGGVKRVVDPRSNLLLPFLPHGRFAHVAPLEPVANWATDFETTWWKDDEKYCIGKLSRHTRVVRILNVLTKQTTDLEVGSEETLEEIQDRYEDWNTHSVSYTWKVLDPDDRQFRPLDMDRTLDENGIPDHKDELDRLGIPAYRFVPTIHAYFNDDLTVA